MIKTKFKQFLCRHKKSTMISFEDQQHKRTIQIFICVKCRYVTSISISIINTYESFDIEEYLDTDQ